MTYITKGWNIDQTAYEKTMHAKELIYWLSLMQYKLDIDNIAYIENVSMFVRKTSIKNQNACITPGWEK